MNSQTATVPARLEDLTVRYGRTTACDGISLKVTEGMVYALLGRNGAGKTSAIRCLLGHRRPDAGGAFLFGRPAARTRRAAMMRIGFVPERPDAPPDLTAGDLLSFHRGLYRTWDAAGVLRRLKRVGVPIKTPFGSLSRGQQSHVQLALALGHGPELLILDDPTLGLDAVARRAFYEETVDHLAASGAAVFIATHDLDGVEGLASRVGFLAAGRILLEEDLERLKEQIVRIRFLDGSEAAGAREGLPAGCEILSEESLGGTVAWVLRRGADAAGLPLSSLLGTEVQCDALSLEEIFVSLCGETADEGGAS